MLYNIPSRTVINLDPDFLAELARDIADVVAVKQANNDELAPIEGLDVLAGNDNIFCRTLEIGGTGGILVASHLVGPRMRGLYDAAVEGDLDTGARDRRDAAGGLRGHGDHREPDSGQGRRRDARA